MVPDTISSVSDMKDAVKSRLIQTGSWSDIQARLRAEVFHALNDKTVHPPDKSGNIQLAVELIKDFMHSIKLDSSLSVFSEETGETSDSIDRRKLGADLGIQIVDNEGDVPLLLLLIQNMKEQEKTNEIHRNTALQQTQEF